MGQIGAGEIATGVVKTWPEVIDTIQTWQNAVGAAPDSETRVDSEYLNDVAVVLRNLQIGLGAMPQGTMGSVAARLNQFLPGAGSATSILDFLNRINVLVPGTTHRLGTRGLIAQLYSDAVPAVAFEPASLTVDQTTYDVLAFLGDPTSGNLVLSGAAPYIRDFVNATTVTVTGAAHGLGTADLVYRVYENTHPSRLLLPTRVTVDPGTFDVVVTFADPMTGFLVLSNIQPAFAVSFSAVPTLTIPGGVHGLDTRALVYQCWDAQTPRHAFEPQQVTVHPATYDVTVTFGSPLSGRFVLGRVADFTGTDFTIQDGGVVNQTATRIFSRSGDVSMQAGSGGHVYIRSKTGAIVATILDNGNLGLGTTTPAYRLHLTTDSAAKPATSTWAIFSDARLKEVLRPYTDGLDLLVQLEPLWYRYTGAGGMPRGPQEHVGLVAQDVERLAPYMVGRVRGRLTPTAEETDILTLDSHSLTYVLLNAVKELHARLERLEAQAQNDALPDAEELP
jgi:hypothetical protein